MDAERGTIYPFILSLAEYSPALVQEAVLVRRIAPEAALPEGSFHILLPAFLVIGTTIGFSCAGGRFAASEAKK